jgi:hypothetical protein
LYFACRTCKRFVDAGYRWAYWNLERASIVQRGQLISVDAVLSATDYWGGAETAVWLPPVLTRVRAFILDHQAHDLIFGEEEDFITVDTLEFLDWIEDADAPAVWTPRHFTERLHFTHWREVEHYLRDHPCEQPWWWGIAELRLAGRRKFDQLIVAQPRLTM